MELVCWIPEIHDLMWDIKEVTENNKRLTFFVSQTQHELVHENYTSFVLNGALSKDYPFCLDLLNLCFVSLTLF